MIESTVTVRELRQNLSIYLGRVEAGEALAVTRRGERVAVLAPLPGRGSLLDRLVAEGRATAPKRKLEDLGPPLKSKPGEKLPGEALEEQRAERLPPE